MSITAVEFDYVRRLVSDYSAICLDNGKEYLVEMRLAPVARKIGIGSIGELIGQLRGGSMVALRGMVIDAMTTNETSFFRDHHPFEALKSQVLPELIRKRNAEKRLSIWFGASSTGQEPYSAAMLLREHFPELLGWKLAMVATDISEAVLARARAGQFSQLEVNRGLPAPLLVKYFRPEERDWRLKEEVRRMVEFRSMNLNGSWTLTPGFDLVFMRNVLIYFSIETKKNILRKIAQILRPDGYLFLGASETTLNLDDSFERVPVGKTVCYRLAKAASVTADLRPSNPQPQTR